MSSAESACFIRLSTRITRLLLENIIASSENYVTCVQSCYNTSTTLFVAMSSFPWLRFSAAAIGCKSQQPYGSSFNVSSLHILLSMWYYSPSLHTLHNLEHTESGSHRVGHYSYGYWVWDNERFEIASLSP
jgi:hypothetical protein